MVGVVIYEVRASCPSDRHDAVRARRVHGCMCPRSLELDRERRARYEATPHGQAVLARKNEAQRQRRALDVEINSFFRAELHERIRSLTLAGQSAAAIGVRVGMSTRNVVRIRSKLREQGRLPKLTSVLGDERMLT
jgi:hypothetical protein